MRVGGRAARRGGRTWEVTKWRGCVVQRWRHRWSQRWATQEEGGRDRGSDGAIEGEKGRVGEEVNCNISTRMLPSGQIPRPGLAAWAQRVALLLQLSLAAVPVGPRSAMREPALASTLLGLALCLACEPHCACCLGVLSSTSLGCVAERVVIWPRILDRKWMASPPRHLEHKSAADTSGDELGRLPKQFDLVY